MRKPPLEWLNTGRALFLTFAALLGIGACVLDDYGVVWDESAQQSLAAATLLYAAGQDDTLLAHRDRHYGVAFELPLLLVELALGLDDPRHTMLLRHALTHIFFLVGGLCCGLLTHRLCGSRGLAVLAMLLFVLSPRLYAHSFFNTKDVPFLCMFMIVLLLAQRAFTKDNAAAFTTLGVAVGLLANIRIAGALLAVAVVALRALDYCQAADRRERKRVLATTGLFLGAGIVVLYATWPYLWANPAARFVEALGEMADHPTRIVSLFAGDMVAGGDLPWRYIPVWLAITTPPALLALGGIGAVLAFRRGMKRPRLAFANTPQRFWLLLVATLVIPPVVVAALEVNLYNGWRQMYFLHAPLVLLAALGARGLAAACGVRGKRVLAAVATLAVAATAADLVVIHPHQALHFNYLVDRATPEKLRGRYELDYYETSFRQALEQLLRHVPTGTISVAIPYESMNRDILPAGSRRRLRIPTAAAPGFADFFVTNHRQHRHSGRARPAYAPSVLDIKVFNNTAASVLALDMGTQSESVAREYLEDYRLAADAQAQPGALFAAKVRAGSLYLRKTPCAGEDVLARFLVKVTPRQQSRLPKHRHRHGFEALGFRFGERGARVAGGCLASVPLPDYAIGAIDIGQYVLRTNRINLPETKVLWQAPVPVPPDA